jgi:hypothetical protein
MNYANRKLFRFSRGERRLAKKIGHGHSGISPIDVLNGDRLATAWIAKPADD